MITLLTLTVYVLVVARLTRIVTTDQIGLPVRAWALKRWPQPSMISFLFHCPWCVGWWLALPLAFPAAVVAGLPWWWGFGLWPAASYLVGVLARYDIE